VLTRCPLEEAYEIGDRVDLELSHHASSMLFHRLFGGAKLRCDLFVHLTRDNQIEHFPFAWSQPLNALAGIFHLGAFDSCRSIALERNIDCSEQILVPKRLRKKLESSGLHGSNADRNRSVTADENHGEWDVQVAQLLREVEAAAIRQPDIEHQTGGNFGAPSPQKFLR
jgi:hypothetical protein